LTEISEYLDPRAGGLAQAVVEHQLDAGAMRGFALARAVEDHVLHRLAAQMPGGGFAEHPSHASMTLDLPHPLGPTTPTSCPGSGMWVGSTKDLKPASLIVRKAQLMSIKKEG
jgi:hypothetical protein